MTKCLGQNAIIRIPLKVKYIFSRITKKKRMKLLN